MDSFVFFLFFYSFLESIYIHVCTLTDVYYDVHMMMGGQFVSVGSLLPTMWILETEVMSDWPASAFAH